MSRKYLMSPVQKRLFSINQAQEANITYNIPMILKVQGNLDIDRIQECIDQIIQRHEVLRTHFELVQGKFIQIIEEKADCVVEYEEGDENGIKAAIDAFIRPFALTKAPLMRAGIYRYAQNEELLLLDFHHIIMDGGSMGIFMHELMQLYDGIELEPLKLQYKDYSAWLSKQNMEGCEAYWLNQFEDGVPETELPLDYSRGKVQSFQGSSVEMLLGEEITGLTKKLSLKYNATEYMVILSAFMMFLSKYTGKEDIVIGTPVAGRNHPATYNMLGMFVNTLVIKGDVKGKQTFQELLCGVRDKCLGAFDNQEYEFEQLVSRLGVRRSENRNPLFDIMFALQNNETVEMRFGDIKAEEYALQNKVAKFDLTFNFGEGRNGYVMIWEYNTKLFRAESIKCMMHHFRVVLERALNSPDTVISDISCLDEEESRMITKVFNSTATDYPADRTIVQLFEEVAASYPNKTAVTYKGKSLTYRELNGRANGIAEVLIAEYGVEKNEFVGIVAEKRIEVIAGLLGILKAGGAYLPLDPKAPKKRTKYILEDCKNRIVLGFPKQDACICNSIKILDLLELFNADYEDKNPEQKQCADDLAYLIYTSGTTGEPKGTMIEQRSVVRLVRNTDYTDFKDIRIIQTGSLTFDASTFEIWGALLNGGFLLLVDTDVLMSCSSLKANICRYKINTMWMTSSLYNQMISMDKSMFDDLKTLLIGGEKLSQKHVKLLLDYNSEITLINGYGPTECTTFALTHKIRRPVPDIIPIGRPISNTTAYIMTGTQLCGIGMPGELCLGGPGVARGYLNNEKLNKEKFIDDIFYLGKKLYRTGDLARWRANGDVEYLGRIDEQVKVRGFRIELTEIEKRMMDDERIKAAAVVVKEKDGDKILCAYLVSEEQVIASEVKDRLRENLPEYMIPGFVIQMETLPITTNGKIDTKALPEPLIVSERNYVEPQNSMQANLCEVFQEILECEKVGIDDSFFELGGDSIKAIRLVSRLREYGYEVSVKTIMNSKTVRLIENEGLQSVAHGGVEEVNGACRLSPIQIHFFRQRLKNPNHFNQSFMLETNQKIDMECLGKMLNTLLMHHDQLRAVFHDGQFIRTYNEYRQAELKYYDLTLQENAYSEMERISSMEQALLNIEANKLVKAVVYHTKDRFYLLLVIHHLLVDSISWRILIEDINNIYDAYISGGEPNLQKKTDSYKAWTESLYQYAKSSTIANEVSYWKEVEAQVGADRLFGAGSMSAKHEQKLLFGKVDKACVHKMKYELSGIADVNTLLLLGLSRTVMQICEKDTVSFCMEGHGRYPVDERMIIDRTVGWFTNIYPVCISGIGRDVLDDISVIRETLKSIPNHGIGYGIVDAYRNDLTGILPEITYNYLGEFSMQAENSTGFYISEAPVGKEIADDNNFGTPVSVNIMIIKEELYINISYDTKVVSETFIHNLCSTFVVQIKKITEICLSDLRVDKLWGVGLSGTERKIWDLCKVKTVERSIRADDVQYKVLFAEGLSNEVYQRILMVIEELADDEYIDYVLDMKKEPLALDVMSQKSFIQLCECKRFWPQEMCGKEMHSYMLEEELHVYKPSAVEKMFLDGLEESWVKLCIPVRYRSLKRLNEVLQRLLKEQSAFRTSGVKRNGEVKLSEHRYSGRVTFLLYDLRYAPEDRVEQIRRQLHNYENMGMGEPDDNNNIPLYYMAVLRVSEVQYEIYLKISHCIWDKRSEEIFLEALKGQRADYADGMEQREKNDFTACRILKQSVQNTDFNDVYSLIGIDKFGKMLQRYAERGRNNKIMAYDTALVTLNPNIKALYNDNQWDFSAYMAKHIICANTGYDSGDIPVYIVQEDRRYMGEAFTHCIGSYIDLLPMTIAMETDFNKMKVQETIQAIQKVKKEKRLNIMEFIRHYNIDINFKELYSINFQNMYGLDSKQYHLMVSAMKNKKPGSGYEIVVNEYKDSLVFAYPVTEYCTADIKHLLTEACQRLTYSFSVL